MWGFYNKKNRILANYFYNIITSKFISYWYKIIYNDFIQMKGQDQYLLAWYFWDIAKQNATIHDSYHCDELGGKGFPTKRPLYGTCFVGAIGCCSSEQASTNFTYICPVQCRPKEHKNDWIYC